MGFDALLGNETIKQRLESSFANGKASHCYLITGASGSGKHTLSRLLSAAMQCTQPSKPCCQCRQCRKVLDGAHPDVITVDDEDKVNIPIKLIREACSDLYIRPNEGQRKIYLFPRAQALRADSQNALLKCIEEPPAYGVFIFLCEHAERMLPTVRSRCVELRLSPLREEILRAQLCEHFPDAAPQSIAGALMRSGGYLGQALELLQGSDALLAQSVQFVQAYCSGKNAPLVHLFSSMEKLKREQLRPIFMQWCELLSGALTAHSGLPSVRPECDQIAAKRSTASVLNAVSAIKKAQILLEANVGIAHICGALAVSLQS